MTIASHSCGRCASRRALARLSAAAALVPLVWPVPGYALPPTDCRHGDGHRWTLRGFAAHVDTEGAVFQAQLPSIPELRVIQRIGIDDGAGWGVGLEYRLGCRLGLEGFGILHDLDAAYRINVSSTTSTALTPWEEDELDVGGPILGLGLSVHLTPRSFVDFYLGPVVAVIQYDDFTTSLAGVPFSTDFDDELAYGLTAGLDVPFGESNPWAVAASVRKLWASAESGPVSIDVDPLIATLGLAHRWRGASPPCPCPEPPP